jgi:hypothetical protein
LRGRYGWIRAEQLLGSAEMVGNQMKENPQRFQREAGVRHVNSIRRDSEGPLLAPCREKVNHHGSLSGIVPHVDGWAIVIEEFRGWDQARRVAWSIEGDRGPCKLGRPRSKMPRARLRSTGCGAMGADGRSLMASRRTQSPSHTGRGPEEGRWQAVVFS